MDKALLQILEKEIKAQLELTSQEKLAGYLGISPATMTNMLHYKEKVSRGMWLKVKTKLKLDLNWNHADTANYLHYVSILQSMQLKHLSVGISKHAGYGKSHVYKRYSKTHKNVILVECKNYWSKKSFIRSLLIACGLDSYGTTEGLIERFTDHVMELENPLIIFDQADKLKDPQLDLFMDFYNDLFGHAAFLISGVEALKIRIKKGVQRRKIGYEELWSRIGSKFYDQLKSNSKQDVEKICKANQVENPEDIQYIYNLSEGDLRKVRREVEKRQLLNAVN